MLGCQEKKLLAIDDCNVRFAPFTKIKLLFLICLFLHKCQHKIASNSAK